MSKAIIEKVAEQFSLTKKLAGEVVDVVIAELVSEIVSNEKTRITGLGTFAVKDKPAREARNPATGEKVQVPAKKAVSFKAATALKEAL